MSTVTISRVLLTGGPGFFSRLTNVRLLAATRDARHGGESHARTDAAWDDGPSERFTRIVGRRSSRQISITTPNALMLSPARSLSMIESGCESDPSGRGRER
jgi:hypothetical protein